MGAAATAWTDHGQNRRRSNCSAACVIDGGQHETRQGWRWVESGGLVVVRRLRMQAGVFRGNRGTEARQKLA